METEESTETAVIVTQASISKTRRALQQRDSTADEELHARADHLKNPRDLF